MLDATILHDKQGATAEEVSSTTVNDDDIRIVAPHEYKEAAACLAEAFRHDKIVRYAIDTPDREQLSEEERFRLHQACLEYVTYAHCLQGLVLAVGQNYDCVALWLPPSKNIDDWMTILRSGMWRLNYKLSEEGRIRFFDEFLPLLHETKMEILGERDHNSWYLNYVGTKPEARGRGYPKKVIRYVTKLVSLIRPTSGFRAVDLLCRRTLTGCPATWKVLTISTWSSTASLGLSSGSRFSSSGLLGKNFVWMSW